MRQVAYLTFVLFVSLTTEAAEHASEPPVHGDAKAQVDFILDNPLKESDYERLDRCLYPRSYESVEILDARHLLFIGRRDMVWLNQLHFDCVGLRKDSVLVFEMQQGSLCELDRFHGAPRFALPGDFSAHCTLGRFEPITGAQADVLRDAFSRTARTARQEPQQEQTNPPADSATKDE